MLGITSSQPEAMGFIFVKFGACSKPGVLQAFFVASPESGERDEAAATITFLTNSV